MCTLAIYRTDDRVLPVPSTVTPQKFYQFGRSVVKKVRIIIGAKSILALSRLKYCNVSLYVQPGDLVPELATGLSSFGIFRARVPKHHSNKIKPIKGLAKMGRI